MTPNAQLIAALLQRHDEWKIYDLSEGGSARHEATGIVVKKYFTYLSIKSESGVYIDHEDEDTTELFMKFTSMFSYLKDRKLEDDRINSSALADKIRDYLKATTTP